MSNDTLYLQPIEEDIDIDLEGLKEHTSIFFGRKVEIGEPLGRNAFSLGESRKREGQRQVLARDVCRHVARDYAYDDWTVAITNKDLYPDPHWNFAFGQAWPHEKGAIVSCHRYQQSDEVSTFKRTTATLQHEVGHLYGLDHCDDKDSCVMAKSYAIEDNAERPLYLCPTDLMKINQECVFEWTQRYRDLQEFYRRRPEDFDREITWIEDQIEGVRVSTYIQLCKNIKKGTLTS